MCIRDRGAYAHIRRQFKISIGKMEGIEEPLARIAGNAYVMDAAASLITYGIMLGEKPAVLSAIVKYHCTHRGQQSIIDAMDITGGKGIMLGQSNFLARAYQGAPIAITVEGANILTRSMMIFGPVSYTHLDVYKRQLSGNVQIQCICSGKTTQALISKGLARLTLIMALRSVWYWVVKSWLRRFRKFTVKNQLPPLR